MRLASVAVLPNDFNYNVTQMQPRVGDLQRTSNLYSKPPIPPSKPLVMYDYFL